MNKRFHRADISPVSPVPSPSEGNAGGAGQKNEGTHDPSELPPLVLSLRSKGRTESPRRTP